MRRLLVLVLVTLAPAFALTGCGPSLSARLGDAIWEKTTAPMEAVIAEGADVNALDDGRDAVRPLTKAVRARKLAAVKVLLDKGADPRLPNRDGSTPLEVAARELHMGGKPEVLTLLLARGADPNLENKDGDVPLKLLFDSRSSRERRLCSPGVRTTEETFQTAVTALLSAGADPNAARVKGYTPLYYAAEANCTWSVARLVEAGAKIDDRIALVAARNADMLTVLIKGGLDTRGELGRKLRASAMRLPERERQRTLSALAKAGDSEARRDYENDVEDSRRREAERTREAAATPVDKAAAEARRRANLEAMARKLGPARPTAPGSTAPAEPAEPEQDPSPSTPFLRSDETQCGTVICGRGYVCCVGATSQNRDVEVCRPSSSGCKQGWNAERIKY